MNGKNKEATQRMLAIIVIIAMMLTMGIPLPVIVFFAIVIYFVWRAVQHTERQEIEGIFNFYIAASEILRDDERRWFGFEIAKVMAHGENILHDMRDAPPLVHFALGALAHRVSDDAVASEHLSYILEDNRGNETHYLNASPELQRYVQVLRNLEREPASGPQTMTAIRNLERTRTARAAQMLEESRARLAAKPKLEDAAARAKLINGENAAEHERQHQHLSPVVSFFDDDEAADNHAQKQATNNFTQTVTNNIKRDANAEPRDFDLPHETASRDAHQHPRPPITEVLHDLYDEEKKRA